MAPPIIQWQRFWLPRGHPFLLRQGYLPESGENLSNGDLPLATLRDLLSRKHCVALLGEPGMGKTTTLAQEQAAIQRHCEQTGAQLLWRNLNAFGNEDRLVRALFENETIRSWKQGSHPLYFVLDSFDECHLRIDTLSTLLQQELEGLPTERLSLFIACRPAHWPQSLEERLRELWPEERFAAVELAPLRRSDVQALALASHVAPTAFFEEVERREATSLATRPVTLRFLLESFKRGTLPVDRWQLYREGCRSLAQENNPDRRDSRLRGKLGPEERLVVASRIAALTLLANREEIWLHPPNEEWPGSTSLDELKGGEELVGLGQSLPITDEALRETLDSGLFGAAGPLRVGWAHRTYTEFLAALFLQQRKLPKEQLASLLQHPEDSSRSVVPQLQGMVTWLARQDEDCRELLLEMDPWVLLGSEAFTLHPELAERLVEALLETIAQGRSLGGSDYWVHYSKLTHPNLEAQLRRHLREPRSSERVLSHVLRIASACQVRSLASDYGDVALDESRPINVRIHALEDLRTLGDRSVKERFLPLALRGTGDDAEGHLRVAALALLWPECISTEQLFAILRTGGEGRIKRVSGLADVLSVYLPIAELPLALQWVAERESQQEPWDELLEQSRFESLGTELLDKAWSHLEAPGMLEAFCVAAWVKLKRHRDVLSQEHWEDREDSRRWRVLDGLAASREEPEDLLLLRWMAPPLLREQDFPPLLERAQRATAPEEQERWARLALKVFSSSEPSHLETIAQSLGRHPVIAQVFSCALEMEEPDLPEAGEAHQEQPPGPELSAQAGEPEFARECERLLECIERGEPLRWQKLVDVLLAEEDDEALETAFLTTFQRWSALAPELRSRIVRAGCSFLSNCRPREEPWLEGRQLTWTAACAYWALMLIGQLEPESLERLPESVWRHWTSLVLAFPVPQMELEQEQEEGALRRQLLSLASQSAPVEILRSGRRLLAQGKTGYGLDSFVRGFHLAWKNELLLQVALDKFQEPSLEVAMLQKLLAVLLRHGVPEARSRAESILTSAAEPHQRVSMAALMLLHDPTGSWRTVWPLLQRDVAFGRSVLDEVARRNGDAAIFAGVFDPEQLVDLYVWIERHGGPRAPGNKSAPFDHPRDCYLLQSTAWVMLEMSGSPAVCRALERLNRELPDQDLVHVALVRAQENMRQRAWEPLCPQEILRLLDSRQARVVQSGTQLLEVLMESLARLQAELHGETPALEFLWNEWKERENEPARLRPKKENHLSDWVKRHLEKDLLDKRLVVNREVEIRPTEPSRSGQRVDLRVDALAHSPEGNEERISVIIEVKGCWNKGLWSAMSEQLVGRYLAENACQHGLYLVGWYACTPWDDTSAHPEEGRGLSLERARQLLEAQARELSRGGRQIRAFVLDAAFRTERRR